MWDSTKDDRGDDERWDHSYSEAYGSLFVSDGRGHVACIANFTGRIVDVKRRHDDGVERVYFIVELTHCDTSVPKHELCVEADEYAAMKWIYRAGPKFVMAAWATDHVRAAIQAFSQSRDGADVPTVEPCTSHRC
jgi:hypothetical protein